MNNNDEIEILDDFDFEDTSSKEDTNSDITNGNSFHIDEEAENNSFSFEMENSKEDLSSEIIDNENSMVNENEESTTFAFETNNKEDNNAIETVDEVLPTLEEETVLSESDDAKKTVKDELENPVVEMINNKTTMRLIIVLLVILFIAIILMPKFFELINA